MNKREFYTKLGKVVRGVRVSYGISQEDLATVLGLKSKLSVLKYEDGRTAMPLYYVIKFARHFNVDINNIIKLIQDGSE